MTRAFTTYVDSNPVSACRNARIFTTKVALYFLTAARTVTKLVPSLTEVEQCDDIPQEVSETTTNVSCLHYTVQVCSKKRGKPRKVKYPSVKKWCYKTTSEVGGHNLTTASVMFCSAFTNVARHATDV